MILLILVQYNGSLFIKDKFGKTPLDYVSSEEMRKVIEKLKLENEEETTDKTLKKFSTPTKEMKWSDSKMLSDSIEKDNFKENKIIFKGNVILKEPGRNFYHQIYNRTRSGTIGNENAINNIRKQEILSIAYSISDKEKKNMIIKYIIFFILGLIFLVFFWMLLSSFGAVYPNTQMFIFKNTLISFAMSLIYPFFIVIFPCFFRMCSLKSNNSECMYKVSKFLQIL